METCAAYWQDRTYAALQTLDQRIAQARANQAANQAVAGFLQGLGALLGTALDAAAIAAGTYAAVSQYQYAVRPAPVTPYLQHCEQYGRIQNGAIPLYCY